MKIKDIAIVGLVIKGVAAISALVHSLWEENDCVHNIVSHTEVMDPSHLTMFTDLELRSDGLYYKIFSNPITTPYTGTVNLRVIDGVLIEVNQSN